MRFALLGADSESLALAAAAVAAGHDIVWQGDLAGAPGEDSPWRRNEDRGELWEDLFDGELCDGLLVGRGDADQSTRARQMCDLAKLGRHILCTFPLVDSVLSYFEIDMARSEGGAVVEAFNPLVEGPWAAEFAGWMDGGHPEYGRVEQVQCTRALAVRSPASVLRAFARDVHLLQVIVGPINRIGAHGAAGDAESADAATYATLSVQMQGAGGLPLRWSVEPPERGESLHIAVVCERGRALLAFDGRDRPLLSEVVGGLPGSALQAESQSAEKAAISDFCTHIAAAGRSDVDSLRASRWPDAVRAMELADSIEISLRRGRMIDIHHRELTEQLAFRGVMSAVGCGVLAVVIPAFLAVGWIAGAFKAPLSDYWPHALLALLAAFLALQLLPKLMSSGRQPDQSPPTYDSVSTANQSKSDD